MIKSIYIHIPFCKNICSYCDFCKMFYNEKIVNNYLIELEREIKENYHNEKVETIYIGGGTPSCLTLEQLEKLFNILKIIDKSNLIEFTIEVNPEDITEEKLKLFKENNVNRVSIGFQTNNKETLKLINRNNDNFKEKIDLVNKYINNINIDLIYGFNNETLESLINDLDFITSLDIKHISTYSLMIEEHTKLFIENYQRIDEDTDLLFYNAIIDYLNNKGFNHYEISNFSKENYESKHNLTYWNNNQYYGFGLGASGYINNLRYTNTKNINKYLNGEYKQELEYLKEKDKKVYEMILGLRLTKGINKQEYFNKYNSNIDNDFNIKDLLDKKYLIDDGKFIKIANDKLYQENAILVNFVE